MMHENPTPAVMSIPTKGAVVEAILEALAEAQETPIDDVRSAVLAASPGMPLDSLETVEIMLGLENAFGIRFPDSPETCAAFQSVPTLTDLVRELVREAGGVEGGPS
jgi:acyl carrier protein